MALKDDLISVWELDEASGNALDSHGSNDLAEAGGTIPPASGPAGLGGARDFEAGDTEHLTLADNADLSTGDVDFAVAAWGNLESKGASRDLVAKWAAGDQEYLLGYSTGSDRWYFAVSTDGNDTVSVTATAAGSPSLATWYHVVGWHDSVNNQLGISVNAGTAETAAHSGGVRDGARQFTIGGRTATSSTNSWDGLISQVAFWKGRVPTSAERTEIYASGAGLPYSAWDAPNVPPDTPTISAGTPTAGGVALTSSAFADDDVGDTHAASQWQVTTDADTGFAAPVISTGDDAVNLTSYTAAGLYESTDYRARVRHKDSEGNYSGWSTADTFTTAAGSFGGWVAPVAALAASSETTGFEVAKASDGDYATAWAAGVSGGGEYLGVDLGVACVPRAVLVATRATYADRIRLAKVQGSNTSASAGFADLETVETRLPAYHLNQIDLAGSTAYRWLRVLWPTASPGISTSVGSDVGELRFLAEYASGTQWKCAPPEASPAGGYADTSVEVTLSTPTTGATVYYTTDGSAPTTASTPYSTPFTVSATTTVRAIAAAAGAGNSEERSWVFTLPKEITNGATWYDNTPGALSPQHHIQAHDGHVEKFGTYYYWYGTDRRTQSGTTQTPGIGIRLYRSTDLVNWEDRGLMIDGAAVANATGGTGADRLERFHVRYNSSTSTYVGWGHSRDQFKQVCATAPDPEGPWTVQEVHTPSGGDSRDITFFADPDTGEGWLVYAKANNTKVTVRALSSDWVTPGAETDIIAAAREAPAVWKRDGVYFLLTSGVTSWNHNQNTYYTASAMDGTWTSGGNPFQSNADPSHTTAFESQTTHLFATATGQVVYMGDRWVQAGDGIRTSTYVWLPVTFPTSTSMSISWQESWTPDAVVAGGAARRRRLLLRGG